MSEQRNDPRNDEQPSVTLSLVEGYVSANADTAAEDGERRQRLVDDLISSFPVEYNGQWYRDLYGGES